MTVRITNTSTNDITEWHTTIVNPQYTLNNLGIDGDTVLHNRGVVVTPDIYNSLAFSCNQFGYGSCPPTNVTFNIEVIQGQEYGNIGRYNDFFGSMEYVPAYTGLSYDEFKYGTYVFTANGLQPDSTAVVRIKQSSSDTDIGSFEYTLYIKRNFLPPVSENGSIVIETNKITAIPGDTIDILLKWEDGSNGIVDFSDWQEFSVWLADGFSYGTLLNPATGDTSDAFDVIGKELKLIVHQNVTDANKKIIIASETEVAIPGGERMIRNNSTHTIDSRSSDKKALNHKAIEQNGFVKQRDRVHSQDRAEFEINNPDIVIGSRYLSGIKKITINPFIVEIDPPTVSAGDTARIIPKYMDSAGNYVEFDSLQTFELGMLDGCVLGKLSNAGIDTNYFYGVTQPFYFIADSTVDSGIVSIRVGVIEMNQQNRNLTNNNNYLPESDNPVSCASVNFIENRAVNTNLPVEKKYEILLGETKWYQLKYSDPVNGKLVIDELSGPDYWEDMGSPIKQDVWGDNPVSIVEGEKLGVYWETQKPVWGKNRNLPIGLIRLVGRYWDEGKTNKVKLTALTQNGETASIEIEVKKPTKISSDTYSIQKYKKNVFGVEFNLDSLIIFYASQYGIDPNIIKAQMMNESSFKPATRYEPFPDAAGIQNGISYTNNRYRVVSETNEGAPSIPNDHIYVSPQYYWGYQGTIWEFFSSHSSTLNTNISAGSSNDIYPMYNKNGTLLWFKKPANEWKNRYDKKYNEKIKEGLSENIAKDSALGEANHWLRYDYQNGIMNTGVAQTRMATSYGFLQITYYTALEKYNYTENNVNSPEKLNEIDEGTKFALKTLSGYMAQELGSDETFKGTNWNGGFEMSFRYGLSRYNGSRTNNYGIFYLNESKKFNVK